MKNTAIIESNGDQVLLVSKMEPAFWKRFALALYPIALLAIGIGVLVEGYTEEPQRWPWILFGLLMLLFIWSGITLAWNVLGEEFFRLSTEAIQWGYNFRFFQTNPKTVPYQNLKTKYVEVRVVEGVKYGCLQFYGRDDNGFDQLICATSIPIPLADIQKFLCLMDEMFLEQEVGLEGIVVLDN